MGFPREYQVCHKPGNGISDMGAPTYWRLGRLQTQMTSEGTKDTTQEPEVLTKYRVDVVKFPTWIFNFGPYCQLRPVMAN